MSKEHKYDSRSDTHTGEVTCDHCGAFICEEPYYDNTESKKYEGLNHGIGGKSDYECRNCSGSRKRAYDNYVDPLYAYHSPNSKY